jgi:TetR/AcrR family transcriptional regulator
MSRPKKRPIKPERLPNDARARLFDAAVKEFAENGMAGARTDAIAKAAGVNIALLFYYFKSKEELYSAILEEMFAKWNAALMAPLHDASASPKERILKYVESYFDHAAASVWRPRLVQQELMRSKHSPAIRKLLTKYVKPVFAEVTRVLEEGITGGSFRNDLDVENFIYSISGIVAQYFSHCSALMEISGEDMLSPKRIQARRVAVLDIISAALLNKTEMNEL